MSKRRQPGEPTKQPQTLREFLNGPPAVSQTVLAKAAGVDPSMISLLARGKRHPRHKLLLKLHELTGVPIEALAASRQRRRKRPPPPPPPTEVGSRATG